MVILSEIYTLQAGVVLESREMMDANSWVQFRHFPAINFGKNYYKYNLTKRESECLFYVLKGMTAKVIASRMGITSKTVEKFVQILKEKLGCHCRARLIEKAIKDGMVNVIPEGINLKEFS
ncbi:MAG: helix-turn-helix transcriptional regulator [Gammaproteobacteria bacterium]|nr:helix-turn-helix transcriptional regulator [Gammaproteobacteria bacterium]